MPDAVMKFYNWPAFDLVDYLLSNYRRYEYLDRPPVFTPRGWLQMNIRVLAPKALAQSLHCYRRLLFADVFC